MNYLPSPGVPLELWGESSFRIEIQKLCHRVEISLKGKNQLKNGQGRHLLTTTFYSFIEFWSKKLYLKI